MMEEEPEPDEGKVTLCNAAEDEGNLKESSGYTGKFAWKLPKTGELVPLRGDVRFHDVVFGYVPEKRSSTAFLFTPSRDRRSLL